MMVSDGAQRSMCAARGFTAAERLRLRTQHRAGGDPSAEQPRHALAAACSGEEVALSHHTLNDSVARSKGLL